MNNCVLLAFLYNANRLKELNYLCENISNFDIYITFGIGTKNHIANTEIKNFISKYKKRIINSDYHKNYGVDILPFLKQLDYIDEKKYPFFIKLHGKESKLGRYNHIEWGSILWDSLIGNSSIYNQNINILSQKHVGAIVQPFSILDNRELNNNHKIHILCDTFNINYDKVKNTRFMAGSIFMGKTELYKYSILPHKDFLYRYLEIEYGKVDDRDYVNGTFSHAMERVFGYLVTDKNLKIHKSSMFPVYKIYNSKEKILHLHTTYNNICYIIEDFNLCGQILEETQNTLKIEWFHLNNQKATYKFLDNKVLIRK